MYQVALCEDEPVFFEAQEKVCREIFKKLNIPYHITTFQRSADFSHAFLQEQKRYDLILLDIMMDGLNGIELAREVRKADGEAAIIFITSSRDFVFEGYDVKALHYLMKPVDSAALGRLIAADYQARFQNNYLVLESGEGKLQIAVKDIICLETVGRRVEVTLLGGMACYSGKLLELLAELPLGQFIRCHQSFVLNIQHIRELTKQDAIAVNDKRIPVSRTFSKEVQRAFARQLREG